MSTVFTISWITNFVNGYIGFSDVQLLISNSVRDLDDSEDCSVEIVKNA